MGPSPVFGSQCYSVCTWHGLQQLGVAHLSLPDVGEGVLHPLSAPQEVKHTQVVAHTFSCEHLGNTHTHTHTHTRTRTRAHTHTLFSSEQLRLEHCRKHWVVDIFLWVPLFVCKLLSTFYFLIKCG